MTTSVKHALDATEIKPKLTMPDVPEPHRHRKCTGHWVTCGRDVAPSTSGPTVRLRIARTPPHQSGAGRRPVETTGGFRSYADNVLGLLRRLRSYAGSVLWLLRGLWSYAGSVLKLRTDLGDRYGPACPQVWGIIVKF